MPKGSSSKSTAAIQRLLEERRQYEAWIARLDQAADATPAGVRSRVKAEAEADITQLEELDSLVRAKPGAGGKAASKVGAPPKPGAPKKAVVDELAFLKSVTEDERNAPSPKRASGAQFQPAIPADSARAVPSSASATPTPNNNDDDAEADRTLKCRECGAMNQPTEWYCEQCGAELAAM